ncbi:sugar ABC transporter permease [Clostridia bacterium]|nr:sugar ABC transporter permease [Clostridia bacterium]
MAFQNYKLGRGFFQQTWVGLRFFFELWRDSRFWLAFRNTVGMSVLGLASGVVFPITLALFLNEMIYVRFKRTVQTISYLPHFISWVVIANMFIRLLSPDNGIVNIILQATRLIREPMHFMAEPRLFWWIITAVTIWKETGWQSIIYLSAIAGIDQELYEAATVDGCGRFRRMWHITLPGIRPTIVVLFIMAFGSLTQIGFERQMLMGNAIVQDYSEVIDMYALKYGIGMARYSFGTAIGVFNSLISLVLLLTANTVFKKVSNESVF